MGWCLKSLNASSAHSESPLGWMFCQHYDLHGCTQEVDELCNFTLLVDRSCGSIFSSTKLRAYRYQPPSPLLNPRINIGRNGILLYSSFHRAFGNLVSGHL